MPEQSSRSSWHQAGNDAIPVHGLVFHLEFVFLGDPVHNGNVKTVGFARLSTKAKGGKLASIPLTMTFPAP